MILTPPLCDLPAAIEALNRAHTPFVRIAPEKPLTGSFDVRIDDYKAAYDMTAYLIGLGHRRIGFIKGHPDHGAANARFEGYRAALAHAGLPLIDELCVQGFFSYQSGIEAGERLLSLKKRPTAIFAGNDDMAAAVLAASQRFNLKIPQQLSVAGFDDSLVAQVVWPRLTTCRQPIKEMAEAAVSMLTQRFVRRRPRGTALGSRAGGARIDRAASRLMAVDLRRSAPCLDAKCDFFATVGVSKLRHRATDSVLGRRSQANDGPAPRTTTSRIRAAPLTPVLGPWRGSHIDPQIICGRGKRCRCPIESAHRFRILLRQLTPHFPRTIFGAWIEVGQQEREPNNEQ